MMLRQKSDNNHINLLFVLEGNEKCRDLELKNFILHSIEI